AAMNAGANSHETAEGGHAAVGAAPTFEYNGRVVAPGSAGMAEFEREVMADPDLSEAEKRTQIAAAKGDWIGFSRNLAADVTEQAQANAATAPRMADGPDAEALRGFKQWVETRQDAIKDDPERFALIMEIWAHRVAI